MIAEEKGKYASLYKRLVVSKRVNTYYYVIKHTGNNDNYAVPVFTRKDFRKLLTVPKRNTEMENFIDGNKEYGKIVQEYNRLMESVANQ